jgi:hypothetical protein
VGASTRAPGHGVAPRRPPSAARARLEARRSAAPAAPRRALGPRARAARPAACRVSTPPSSLAPKAPPALRRPDVAHAARRGGAAPPHRAVPGRAPETGLGAQICRTPSLSDFLAPGAPGPGPRAARRSGAEPGRQPCGGGRSAAGPSAASTGGALPCRPHPAPRAAPPSPKQAPRARPSRAAARGVRAPLPLPRLGLAEPHPCCSCVIHAQRVLFSFFRMGGEGCELQWGKWQPGTLPSAALGGVPSR